MTIHRQRASQLLESFDFKKLFVEELGWANARGKALPLAVADETYRLQPIAELSGMRIFVCESAEVPPLAIRRKIEKQTLDVAHEHILIFVDDDHTKAVWQWVKRAEGKSAKAREHTYHKGQSGEALLQKLAGIAFELDELDDSGEAPSVEVTGRVAKSFDVERVTKRFYDHFKEEHAAFLKFIKGVADVNDRAWYTLVMLNRFMFIYFIQKKDFLDGDPDYLRRKLVESQAAGRDRFYRHFLIKLFFEGFAEEEADRAPAVRKVLGRIPYLNGGLFQRHAIELAYGDAIQIPDAVFERLFTFFDGYQWHLDDRPLRTDNEINPDVLGYIFEKYINQKQMGAYYTKEDITGYNCRNTILPFLLDKLGTLRYAAVHPLPLKDIEPYIYPAVKQTGYLPTETEREYAARMKRVRALRADFKAGKMASINDFITYNLDIERCVQDWLRGLDDPLTLRAFYFECLLKLTVLDPTVGSGAFLFAAMNILELLYEICLDKMAEWAGPKYPDFKTELARVAEHPNRAYFIFKGIIVNNLYGVDLMEEATEICKLRLFLKLVAQVSDVNRLEPLPDIDFNIRAGNTLVGYASLAEVEQAASRSLFNLNLPQRIKESDIALRAFRDLQTRQGIGAKALAKAKRDTQTKLAEIEGELNEALRLEYGAKKLDQFVASHRPFHWYVEFNTIMQDGGFDVIVGNPPYVEYSKVRNEYSLPSSFMLYSTNLYSACCFRAIQLKRPSGYSAFIVPVSLPSTDRMQALREVLAQNSCLHIANFSTRPSKLFEGAEQRLTIYIQSPALNPKLYTSGYLKWNNEARTYLFPSICYVDVTDLQLRNSIWPKVSNDIHLKILRKILRLKFLANSGMLGDGESLYYKNTGIRYFSTVTLRPPKCWINGKPSSSSRETILRTQRKYLHAVHTLLLSSLYFLYWETTSNCRDLNPSDIECFPVPDLSKSLNELKSLSLSIEDDYTSKGKIIRMQNKLTGFVELESLTPANSKPIIDEIDRVLARHYGFTDEELDFILNYDIKYRMGKEAEGGEE